MLPVVFVVRKITTIFIVASLPCILIALVEFLVFYNTGFRPIPIKILFIYSIFLYISNFVLYYWWFRISYLKRSKSNVLTETSVIDNSLFNGDTLNKSKVNNYIQQKRSNLLSVFEFFIFIGLIRFQKYIELINKFLTEIVNGNSNAKLVEDYSYIIVTIIVTIVLVIGYYVLILLFYSGYYSYKFIKSIFNKANNK